MNNLQLVIPDSWICPGNNGKGHAYGIAEAFRHRPAIWLGVGRRKLWTPGNRFTDPNYYGHWKYIGTDTQPSCQANPDFFQIIDYAMNQAIGVIRSQSLRNTFNIGAALIDQYDTDDLYDADPNRPATAALATLLRSSTLWTATLQTTSTG